MSTKRKADSHLKAASRPCTMKSGEFQTEAERDSGFSDASSEHLSTMDTTDSEDSPCPVVQQGPQTPGSGPPTPQLAVVGGSYSSLSPMIFMNNVLLKQPGDNPPALKPWGFSPTVEVVQPVVQQPQVVFIQPMVSRQASSSSKESPSRHRRSKKYLPILKSYPKIAPHPGDGSSSSGRGTASSSSSSSLSGSERSSQQDHCHKDKQQRSLPVTPSTVSPLLQNQLTLPTTETTSTGSSISKDSHVSESTPSFSLISSPDTKNPALPPQQAPSQEIASAGELDAESDMKRKRFCNTYNILSKSGLLDITLRTKELLRQNRRTQTDLERLKEHTDLFLQALRSGDSSICGKLQASLQEEDKERERATQAEVKAD